VFEDSVCQDKSEYAKQEKLMRRPGLDIFHFIVFIRSFNRDPGQEVLPLSSIKLPEMWSHFIPVGLNFNDSWKAAEGGLVSHQSIWKLTEVGQVKACPEWFLIS
jgi:hypothetical protein